MKIQFASDLHLEFSENARWLRDNPLRPVGQALVLAGDIGYLGDEMYQRHPFWDWCADNFERTIIVPGNHELYRFFDINELHEGWELQVRANVSAVYNKVVRLGDVDLVASTLWARIHPADAFLTERGAADFSRIRDGERRLTWERFNAEHDRCVGFIARAVADSQARARVVATHHVPSFELMSPEFAGSRINGAFTSDLNKMLRALPIDYWIYGHSHRNIEREVEGVKCVTNQLGYVLAGEHGTFLPDKIIEA